MTDKKLVMRKLSELEECVGALEKMRKYDIAAIKSDKEKEWAVEHGLQISIQIVVDIGAHILASVGEGDVEDYAEIIERLGKRGIIPEDFAGRIKGMTGFRNILVHEYAKIDIGVVCDMLKNRLEDFREFAGHVNKYMEGIG